MTADPQAPQAPAPDTLCVRLDVSRPGWHTLTVFCGGTVLCAASFPDVPRAVTPGDDGALPTAVILPAHVIAALWQDAAATS